jgi:hypothetical protein
MSSTSANNDGRKPWIMNAFAMAAPGHLAPGTSKMKPIAQILISI